MTTRLRIIGSCVSLTVFVALLGLLASTYVAAQPEGVKCPCDFGFTSKTKECWSGVLSGPAYAEQATICSMVELSSPFVIMFEVKEGTTQPTENAQCRIGVSPPRDSSVWIPCGGPFPPSYDGVPINLTPEELKACQCELLAYTTALNEVEGITVSGGPPYVCGDVDCRQKVLTPIPTLNEYGMIITAGVLGLLAVIGLFVMRRRKVTA